MGPVLVTGGTGLLGCYVANALAKQTKTVTTARRGGDFTCDLTSRDATRALLDEVKPTVIVHLAALTNVDICEQNPESAQALNTGSTKNLIEAAGSECRFLYVSTDQVYPDCPGPHPEETAAPVNVYGRTKFEAETYALNADGLVLRANFFGPSLTPGRKSLSDFFVEAFTAGTPVNLFEDSFFSPLHVESVSSLVVELLQNGVTGCFNLGSRSGMSKADFARSIARHMDLSLASASSAQSASIRGRAKRPLDLRMDVSLLETVLGRSLPTLEQEITKL